MNSTSTIAHQKTEQTENIESRIIEAAKQEFIKKGFEQTSMSDIAAVVGINRPTLHYYFRTKDKMFQSSFRLDRCKIFTSYRYYFFDSAIVL